MARVVQEREVNERMDWPGSSSDFYPIEHMWNEMQVRISARPQSRIIQGLGSMLVQELAVLPVRTFRNLIEYYKALPSCHW
jgi:hypothetical protein